MYSTLTVYCIHNSVVYCVYLRKMKSEKNKQSKEPFLTTKCFRSLKINLEILKQSYTYACALIIRSFTLLDLIWLHT